MTCDVALERLLEADLSDLRAEADSELSRHLRACPECRSAADRIVEAEVRLAADRDTVESRVPVTEALAVARRRAGRRRRVKRLRFAAPLAAAAGIAALVLGRGPVPPSAPPLERGEPAGIDPAGVALDVGRSPGRTVAVFSTTSRPDVVVIWFY